VITIKNISSQGLGIVLFDGVEHIHQWLAPRQVTTVPKEYLTAPVNTLAKRKMISLSSL